MAPAWYIEIANNISAHNLNKLQTNLAVSLSIDGEAINNAHVKSGFEDYNLLGRDDM
jgi:hypothetical protein